MAKVAIWMGHSGSELGAKGIVLEDDVTRQARTWAVAYARACGHTVTTDNDNMSLTQRINASTKDHAGILEWHANLLGTGAAHGTEVWYSQYDSGKGQAIANAMTDRAAAFGFTDRGAKNSATNRYGRLGILDTPKPTAVLVELFFLDNQGDVNLWNAHGKKLVEAMTAQFLKGLGLKSSPSGNVPDTPSKPSPSIPAPSQPSSPQYQVKTWNKKQVVDIDILNVRTTANSQSKLVRQLKKGQTFNATRIITNGEQISQYKTWFEADGWGWVSGAYVTEIKQPTVPSTPQIAVDGYWGTDTTKRLQQIFGTTVDGVISKPSNMVKAMQKRLGVTADGYLGKVTITALQRHYGTYQDGVISKPSNMVKAMQRTLNQNKF